MGDRTSFIFHYEYAEYFAELTGEEIGQLIPAIIAYDRDGVKLELTGKVQMAFLAIRLRLDKDRKEWEKKCQKNRNNGRMGGRPVKAAEDQPNHKENQTVIEETQKTERLFQEPKKPDIDFDSDIDIEKDIITTTTTTTAREAIPVPLDDNLGKIYREWEQASGKCSSYKENELIAELFDQYGYDRMKFAITEAVRNNAVKLSYVEGVLKGNNRQPRAPNIDAAEQERLRAMEEWRKKGRQ